jgi:hypothetical protein
MSSIKVKNTAFTSSIFRVEKVRSTDPDPDQDPYPTLELFFKKIMQASLNPDPGSGRSGCGSGSGKIMGIRPDPDPSSQISS